MPLADLKTLDTEFDGAALLAAVLYPSPRARDEALERGRQRLARAGTFAETMSSGAVNRAEPKTASLA